MKGYTVYAKSKNSGSGIEVSATTAKKEGNGETRKEGRVTLRFFTFEKESESIRFILNPVEAYWISLKIAEVVKNGKRQFFTHKFDGENGKVVTTLTLEKWEREREKEVEKDGEKKTEKVLVSGYGMNIKRGESKISVSMDIAHFLFVAELFRTLSTEQAWSQYKEAVAEEGVKTEEAAADSEQSPDSNIQGQAPEPTPEHVEGETEQTVAEPVSQTQDVTEEPKAEKPVQKPAAGSNNGNGGGKMKGAVIDSVSEDGKTIKVGDLQLKITDKTKGNLEKLAAGMKINLYYRGNYANGIYAVNAVKQQAQ